LGKNLEDKLKNEVFFEIILTSTNNENLVRDKFELEYPEITLVTLGKTKSGLYGFAPKETYESVFDAVINKHTITPPRTNARIQTYWVETKKAEVPNSLKDYISKINIPKPVIKYD